MANWKIQDIAPPKKRASLKREEASNDTKPEKPKRRRTGGARRAGFALLALAVLGPLVLHVFFAKAEVSVWPETREVKILEPISAEVGLNALDKENRILPARTLTQEEKATRLFKASSTTVKENKASGTIRVFNAFSGTPYTLIATTRFVSEDGKLFRTPERITIPGKTGDAPGFLDVEVVAAQAGEDYNIGPSSFSVPGLSGSAAFTAIYAESTGQMTGGSERTVSVVSDKDIEESAESLIEELRGKAIQSLLSRVPEHMIATEDSVVVEVTEAGSLVEAGAELDQFNVSVSLRASAYLFSRDDVDVLAEEFLAPELGDSERAADGKTKIVFEQFQASNDELSLELGIEAVAYEYVDPTELKIRLRGKSKAEADSILNSYGAFSAVEVSLWPFWISSIPGNVDKLTISVFID